MEEKERKESEGRNEEEKSVWIMNPNVFDAEFDYGGLETQDEPNPK